MGHPDSSFMPLNILGLLAARYDRDGKGAVDDAQKTVQMDPRTGCPRMIPTGNLRCQSSSIQRIIEVL